LEWVLSNQVRNKIPTEYYNKTSRKDALHTSMGISVSETVRATMHDSLCIMGPRTLKRFDVLRTKYLTASIMQLRNLFNRYVHSRVFHLVSTSINDLKIILG
jgi:hypothetical protein